MQVPILSGITTDAVADFRTAYPRNRVPVLKDQGISDGYLRPAPGIAANGEAVGLGRGGVNWNGVLYRVSGAELIKIGESGGFERLGSVGDDGKPVSFTYSFDRLAIASAGHLYYLLEGELTEVTDSDLGTVLDVNWIQGYFMTTDGADVIVTDLTDPTSVNPLFYGAAEDDPDPIYAVRDLRGEAYAFGRYTIQVFQNVGGNAFPFEVVEGATVTRGVVGTHAVTGFLGTFAFVGGGRNKSGPEPVGVWLMTPGDSQRLSTREIETVLQGYDDATLAGCVMESRNDRGNQQLLIHLPDQTLVYDYAASQIVQGPVWTTFDSGLSSPSRYRARGLVWCYGRWNVDDPTSSQIGYFVDDVSSHYGARVGWEFYTLALYNQNNGAIVHDIELSALTGRIALGDDPTIWASYSLDGVTWSQERAIQAGKRGERNKRLQWRGQGQIGTWRVQKFRGNSDAHLSFARLDMTLEPLSA